MKAETLIGTVLGTCTLQKLLGQGGMGAVFLAQQSRPKRQVAVKVLLPMTPLSPNQLAAFLERFRRETDAAASLEHPNIMPVHEYGERDGLAYLVMPFIAGGTLRDELEREGPLPYPKAVNYLEQLAAALDIAHDNRVIHRDIKPANIMVTPEGRLLLGDFGLVKILAEGQAAQVRLTGAGAPVGTPDYMAPEQVIGEEVDPRADVYSLGVLLFQMITGTTPFHGETPMQIAAQHLQLPPPSPQMLRPDLPIGAEQVIQRAMAKRPADRFMRASDLAQAFRQALINVGIQLDPSYTSGSGTTGAYLAVPKGQFEPLRQTASMPKIGKRELSTTMNSGNTDNTRNGGSGLLAKAGLRPTDSQQYPAIPAAPAASDAQEVSARPTGGGGLLSRTGKFPMAGATEKWQTGQSPAVPTTPAATPVGTGGGLLSRTGKFPTAGSGLTSPSLKMPIAPSPGGGIAPSSKLPSLNTAQTERIPFPTQDLAGPATGSLGQRPGYINSRTLENPVKVVQVPVAGQPGQYVTGLLPVAPPESEGGAQKKGKLHPGIKIALVVMAVLIIVAGLGAFLLSHNHAPTRSNAPTKPAGPPNPTATILAHATATAQANTILFDPLNHNSNSWFVDPTKATFKDGGYQLTDVTDDGNGQGSILPTNTFGSKLGYQLTMEELAGDDTQATNSFGMIFRFTQDAEKKGKDGKPLVTFYSFEVVNVKGGEYQFWKYDSSQDPDKQWSQIGHLQTGDEFHQGQGAQAINTFKVQMDGNQFTILVNGKQLSQTFKDDALTGGKVGMIVNLKGTKVQFTNLLLTKN